MPKTAVTQVDEGVTTESTGARKPRDRFGFITRRHLAYEAVYFVAAVGAVALALSLAGRRAGWPVGQTFGQDPLIVQIYAAHFRHGDLLPVWSSSDAYGYGTPVLLYYHKAFFILGGVLFILFDGALKPALLVTLAVFMLIGAYGMRAALGVVTGERTIQAAGSLGFLFANWSFVEWLSRGDLAEFSALMVVPWLLYWCLTLVKYRRVSWSIIPTMVVLVDAHSAVALVSTVVLAITAATFLVTFGLAGIRAVYRRIVVAVVATTLILAPMLMAELRMSRDYDPASKITEFGATVARHFVTPWWGYLYLPDYRWLSLNNSNLNVQLDLAVTGVLAAGLVAVAVRWLRRSTSGSAVRARLSLDRPVATLLLVSLGAYLFLQFRLSLPIYDVLSPIKVITFPYRMMTFITPLAFLCVGMVADWYFRTNRRRSSGRLTWVPVTLAALWLVAMVLLSPVTAHEPPPRVSFIPDAPFIPVQALTPPPRLNFQAYPQLFAEFGPMFIEYLPKVAGSNGTELPSDATVYRRLHTQHANDASLSSVPCSVVQRTGTTFESLGATYDVHCAGPSLVALPVSYNSFTSVTETGPGGQVHPVVIHHVPTDPRIVIQVRDDRVHHLDVHLPTLMGILFG